MKDILAGAMLVLFSLFFLVPGLEYGIGTVNRPGAGGIPVVVAILMALFGAAIGVSGFLGRAGADQAIRPNLEVVRHIGCVGGAIAAFALSIESLGLLPATVLVVMIASFAESSIRIPAALAASGVMFVVLWLIFIVALEVNVPIVRGVL